MRDSGSSAASGAGPLAEGVQWKLLEMRMDALKTDIDSRVPVSGLDEIQVTVNQRLEHVETKAREDLGVLSGLLRSESADDRRRLERSFEALQRRMEAQLELVDRTVRSGAARPEERPARLEAQPGNGRDEDLPPAEGAPEFAEPAEEQPCSRGADLGDGAERGGEELRALRDRLGRLEDLADGCHAELRDAQADVCRRLGQLESCGREGLPRGAAQEEAAATEAAAAGGEAARAAPQGAPAGGEPQPRVAERLAALESALADLESRQSGSARDCEKAARSSEEGLRKVSRSVEALTGYLLQGAMGEQEKAAADPLERLQLATRGGLQAAQGHGLEMRLRQLESQLGSGLADTIARLDGDLCKLDVDDLSKVRPDIQHFQGKQSVFNADVEQDVKELKCVVGCLEACIPKDTRKAVQLFKRAAGLEEHTAEGMDLVRLQLEGRILSVQPLARACVCTSGVSQGAAEYIGSGHSGIQGREGAGRGMGEYAGVSMKVTYHSGMYWYIRYIGAPRGAQCRTNVCVHTWAHDDLWCPTLP